MPKLDPKTLDLLAELIVDVDGTFARTGRDLEALLVRAGWDDPPEYDGSPRIAWLREAMSDRVDDGVDIERLACRVCDPLEYDDGFDSAGAFREEVNIILRREQLLVTYVGGRPVLGDIGADGTSPIFSEPTDLERRIGALVSDSKTADLLIDRVRETRICEAHGAYTFAIIGIGSLIEGLLLAVLTEHVEELRKSGFPTRNGGKVDAKRAGLEVIIDTAHAQGYIQLDAKDFMTPVRHYRNFVHPRAQLDKNATFDQDSVQLCWGPVGAVLNDLEVRLSS